MKIELELPAVDRLSAAIEKLANSLKGLAPEASLDTVQIVSEAVQTQTTPEPQGELTPAQARKQELIDQIIALGGTPPERGAVKKYEEALASLQESQAEEEASEEETPEEETPEEETPEEETPEIEIPEELAEDFEPRKYTFEEVQTIGGQIIRPNGPSSDVDMKGLEFVKKVLSDLAGGPVPLTDFMKKHEDKVHAAVEQMCEKIGLTAAQILGEA